MSKSKAAVITGTPAHIEQIIAAAEEYIARRDRRSHPDGSCDKGGRWYPSEYECCECCDNIRSPSRGWPWSLMVHCRTAEHVANLHDVDPLDLKRVARLLDADGATKESVLDALTAARQSAAAGSVKASKTRRAGRVAA